MGTIAGKQTINRGELHAVRHTLQRMLVRVAHVESRRIDIHIYTDSDYVYKNWYKNARKHVQNIEMWTRFWALSDHELVNLTIKRARHMPLKKN